MEKIKMGMIGGATGAFFGDAHRRAARISNDFEVIGGIFSSDYEKSKEFAVNEGFDLKRVYKNIDTFIKGELSLPVPERIKVVAIVTPNALHYPHAKKLLLNGFHLICEKPMTINVKEAVDLQNLVIKNKLTFALAHTYTGYPMVRQMRELIAKGIPGKIQRIDAQYYQGWVNSVIYSSDNRFKKLWRFEPELAGKSLCMGDIGVHAFNMIEYTTGLEIKEVLADLSTVKKGIDLDLDGTVLIRLKDNIKGVIRASQVCGGEENNLSIAVYGSKASFKWSQENPNYLYLLSESEPARIFKPAHRYNSKIAEESHTMPAGHPEGVYEALANIYKGAAKSIRKKKFDPCEFPTVYDGVRGMKFINAVVESNKKGNIWVKI